MRNRNETGKREAPRPADARTETNFDSPKFRSAHAEAVNNGLEARIGADRVKQWVDVDEEHPVVVMRKE